MLGWLIIAAVAADARPKPNTKPDTLFKGPGVTILDRQGVQAIRNKKRVGSSRFMRRGAATAATTRPNLKSSARHCRDDTRT